MIAKAELTGTIGRILPMVDLSEEVAVPAAPRRLLRLLNAMAFKRLNR
jgi:hypothetical protein